MFGLSVDAHHLPCHHTDVGTKGDKGEVSAAVRMTAGRRHEDEDIKLLIC